MKLWESYKMGLANVYRMGRMCYSVLV